jgi:hypothetical protein
VSLTGSSSTFDRSQGGFRIETRCGSVLPQIMRLEIDANQIAGIFHDQSGCGIGKRENPCILLNAIVTNIFLESIYHFLWQENHLGFPAAFWISDHNFAVFNIHWGQFKDLSDPHTPTGHQLQQKTIPGILCSENDFIDHILFKDFELGGFPCPEQFAQRCIVTWVLKIRIDGIVDVIEKGCKKCEK